MAITWRNVGGGDNAGAIRNLMAASGGITNAFDGLRDVVKDAELADKQNMDLVKKQNTDAFLNTLYSQYSSPEALDAAIKSGEVASKMQAYGSAIDASATRGAADSRLAALRQQSVAGMQYENQVIDNKDQAALSRLKAAAFAGDPQAAQELANISDRNKGSGAETLFTAERARFGYKTEQNKEVRADRSLTLDENRTAAQIEASRASASAARASAAASNLRTQIGQVELKDRVEARKFENVLQNEVRQHHFQTSQMNEQIKKIAADNPMIFPVDKSGNVAFNQMNSGQRDAATTYLRTQGLPPLDSYIGGDTAAQERLVSKLVASGAPLSVVDKVKTNGSWFDTSKPAPVGRDAALKVAADKQRQVWEQRQIDAAGGIPTKAGDFTEVMNTVGSSIPKDGADKIKRDLARYYEKGGIDVKGTDEEKPQKRFLPANVIAQIVQGTDTGWFGGKSAYDKLLAAEKDFAEKLSGAVKVEDDKKVRGTIEVPAFDSSKTKSRKKKE